MSGEGRDCESKLLVPVGEQTPLQGHRRRAVSWPEAVVVVVQEDKTLFSGQRIALGQELPVEIPHRKLAEVLFERKHGVQPGVRLCRTAGALDGRPRRKRRQPRRSTGGLRHEVRPDEGVVGLRVVGSVIAVREV